MGLFSNLTTGLRALFGRETAEREMDDELRGFLESSAAEKVRSGMTGEQALRAARAEMGSTNAVKHHIRSAGWESQLEILFQDLRYGLRTLLRSPGFAIIAILSLGLGIGANTAIFTLIHQVLLENLPVRDPQQLVVFGKSTGSGVLGGIDLGFADQFTYDFAHQLEANPGPFQGVAAYSSFSRRVNVRTAEAAPAHQVSTSLVSGNFFSLLGAAPLLGRTIIPSDADAPGRNAVVVISQHLWREFLSADRDVVGRTISINGAPFVVVGVMPEAFHGMKQGLEPPEMWVPVTMADAIALERGMLRPRSLYYLHMFARRNPRSNLASDQNWLDRQIREYIRASEGATISSERQQDIERESVALLSGAHGVSFVRDQYGASLKILMTVVAVVLLIACANLANFLLARSAARQREIATRLALGSSRGRIIRQSILESLLLSCAGGALGFGFAFAATRALIAFVAQGATNTVLKSDPDVGVLLFTVAVSVVTGLLIGLAPALSIVGQSAAPALNATARTSVSSGGRSSRLWPKALVVSQVTLSVVLLVGAGLFLRTLTNLLNQDFGFERSHLLLAQMSPRLAGWKPEQAPAMNQRLIDRLESLPNVRSAALSESAPISTGTWQSSIKIPGYTPKLREDMESVLNRVSSHYFDTAGISVVSGRAINAGDTATTMKVAVINQTLARRFFPKGDAVGRNLSVEIDDVAGPWQIVGVARDTKSGGPREDIDRMVYLPLAQIRGAKGEGIEDSYAATIEVRTVGDPANTIHDLRRAAADVDPNLPIIEVRTIEDQVDTFINHEALISRLTIIFAALALLLAGIGLYGVMSFNVVRRRNEIGIRIALGASGNGVQWMVLRESLILLATGLVIGIPVAMISARLIRSQLFAMGPFDPVILCGAVVVIGGVTLLSAWLPARRAAAIDPMEALRCD